MATVPVTIVTGGQRSFDEEAEPRAFGEGAAYGMNRTSFTASNRSQFIWTVRRMDEDADRRSWLHP